VVDRLLPGDPSHIGPFRLLGRLGEGGMGRVYLGASPGGRKVAIKTVHYHFAKDGDFRRRFAREVAAARQVGGFHTALVVDADPDAEFPWMATAYISGPSLANAVERQGPLDETGVRELGAALAEGLAAIHACGIIHRDLKPSNVILADDGARIIDFGIAKGADATELTASHAVIGSLRFMSPEQLNGQELTPQSDVFALGTVLAYAATGHDPFAAPSVPAVINHILNDPPDLDPLAGQLRTVINGCLAKDPGSRPALSDLLASFTDPGRRDPTVVAAASGPGPAPVVTVEPLTVGPGSGRPDLSARAAAPASGTAPAPETVAPPPKAPALRTPAPAPKPATSGSRAPAPAASRTPAPAPRTQPQWRHRRTSLILAAAAVVVAGVAAFALDHQPATNHPANGRPAGAAQSSKTLRTLSDPTSPRAASVAFSPRGSTLAVGGFDRYTTLWSVTTGKTIATLPDPLDTAHPDVLNAVNAVAFSPDGATLAVGDEDGGAYLWNVTTHRITETFSHPAGIRTGVYSVAFSPNGATLAVGDANGSTYLWNVAEDQVTAVLTPSVDDNGVSSLAFSPNGAKLAVAGYDGSTYLWRVANDRLISDLTAPASDNGVISVAFNPNGTTLAVGDDDGGTYLWDLATRKTVGLLTTPGLLEDQVVAFSPDGTTLATGDDEGSTYLWDLATRKITHILTVHKSKGIVAIAFSPNGTTLATGDANGSTHLWTLGGVGS
jgi:hypothetical protein